MEHPYADGAATYRAAYLRGLTPDPELWIDEWADEYQRIPKDTGAAEPGKYHTDRTPFAREPMRCLSPLHPCKRVVTMVASQLMKTQIGLNWIGGTIHMAPANILALLPSEKLARRVSSRIDKTIKAVPVLANRVAKPRSRDARNTLDTKEFEGGTLYCTTAGSASNLAELAARYIYGDEIDRWDVDVDSEGDPIELAEARGSTFGRKAKFYFSSSPTLKGVSRIADLYDISDQRRYFVPCPHCGEYQVLEWANLQYSADYSRVDYLCSNSECGALIEEHHKTEMLLAGEWRATAEGDGETVGFHLSALYSPIGWLSWHSLAKQYDKAKLALDRGDAEPMQVFYNTRLALVWDAAQEQTKAGELKERAEPYHLGTVPAGALILTAAVDVQHNRLELLVIGWGEGLERWVVDYQVVPGDPSDERTWALLDERLKARYRHASGVELAICAASVDSGGHHTDEVYQFTRLRRWRNVIAVKGASKPGRPVLAQRPSKVDVTRNGKTEKAGAELWMIGTDTAKDWIYNRYPFKDGPGALHFSHDLPDDFYEQAVVERKLTRYVKGYKRVEWVKGKAERNEVLDLLVYNLAAAQFLGLHRYRESEWAALRGQVCQGSLFSEPKPAEPAPQQSTPAHQAPARPALPAASARRTSHSGYLSRRR
ncbi:MULTISPECIES: phage terminase large subunit family protein [unclassified Pseudomonas]|uniref:phage terminase large subunit family protein n=1 Tax=unclassified Pseudomonas TaxID=196821 RepID=UPI00244CBD6C|nr:MULTISPECIES: phage terminase large subunit family protein [unclassified Pseudomonas]MDH0894232.1 phage terminase large subunit family protein [Pseudomonas sp. GD03875]MDH1063473.1 phage terminase large subunit family protein [Pseudomonas sp. GD03985]